MDPFSPTIPHPSEHVNLPVMLGIVSLLQAGHPWGLCCFVLASIYFFLHDTGDLFMCLSDILILFYIYEESVPSLPSSHCFCFLIDFQFSALLGYEASVLPTPPSAASGLFALRVSVDEWLALNFHASPFIKLLPRASCPLGSWSRNLI